MTDPLGEQLDTDLIERYLRTRRRRYFRGQHDREYFFVASTDSGRLHVHLGISRWQPDVFTIRIEPACFFPAADDARLAGLAEEWNQGDHDVTAIVHGSSDPQRIGVYASAARRITDGIGFEDFAAFVDRAVAAATDLFGELTPVAELPAAREPLVRDAG